MSVNLLLRNAATTVQNFTKGEKTLLKQIGSLFKSQSELRKAVHVIQENQPLIKKLKTGSKEEQELGALIERVVADYNRWVDRSKKRLRPVPDYIFPTVFKCHTQEHHFRPIVNEDLLWMRKVSVTNLPKDILRKYQVGANVFETLPGEVFVFTDSSYLLKSQQTGYPDPSLLPAAFPELFLPNNLHLHEIKAEIAEGLLPKGKFNAKARRIYNYQKECDFRDPHKKFLKDLPVPQDLAKLHRTVNRAFNGEGELDGDSQALFNTLQETPREKLAWITSYQQLFFYKLLRMPLDLESFRKEIKKYFQTLTLLFYR